MKRNPIIQQADPAPESALDRGSRPLQGSEWSPSQALPTTTGPRPRVRWRRGLCWLIVCLLAATGWYFPEVWMTWIARVIPPTASPASKREMRPTPVVTSTVRQQDLPIFLNGLGAATAFKTVTVRTRVDGELVNVAFTEGQMVQEGELLAEIDPRSFEVLRDQAEGQRARDEATLKLAHSQLARFQDLIKSKTIVQQQVDEQIALIQQAEGSLQANRAAVAHATLQLTYCRIIAPMGGRIGLRLVDQGNIVLANDALGIAVINQLHPIAVVFTIPQDDIARVQAKEKPGQPLVVEAFDREFRTKLAQGSLLAIDNQVDPATGTVRLKAIFENEGNRLFPNQFVNVRLLIETVRDAILVPSAAIQRGPRFSFVYVVQADQTVELRPVELGPVEGGETSITTGLVLGEIVVTEGLDKLQPGGKVILRERETQQDKTLSEPEQRQAGDAKGGR